MCLEPGWKSPLGRYGSFTVVIATIFSRESDLPPHRFGPLAPSFSVTAQTAQGVLIWKLVSSMDGRLIPPLLFTSCKRGKAAKWSKHWKASDCPWRCECRRRVPGAHRARCCCLNCPHHRSTQFVVRPSLSRSLPANDRGERSSPTGTLERTR